MVGGEKDESQIDRRGAKLPLNGIRKITNGSLRIRLA